MGGYNLSHALVELITFKLNGLTFARNAIQSSAGVENIEKAREGQGYHGQIIDVAKLVSKSVANFGVATWRGVVNLER